MYTYARALQHLEGKTQESKIYKSYLLRQPVKGQLPFIAEATNFGWAMILIFTIYKPVSEVNPLA